MLANRVVIRVGLLIGKIDFLGINLMQKLGGNEGIVVTQNKVQEFETLFWDSAKELT